MKIPFLAACLGAVLLVGACSSKPGGSPCSYNNDKLPGPCEQGLTCMSYVKTPDAGSCTTPSPDICTKRCTTDSDCSVVGPNFKCFYCGVHPIGGTCSPVK